MIRLTSFPAELSATSTRISAHERVIIIGNFDGVHLGHKALITHAKHIAEAKALPLCVLTFEPHPVDYFCEAANIFRLTSARTKIKYLCEAGVDEVIVADFDHSFSALTAEAFVESVLVQQLKANVIIVGADFRFGASRKGDFSLLQHLGTQHNFSTEATPLLDDNSGDAISSTRIRKQLTEGHIEAANHLLGRCWSLTGKVVHGAKRGRTLGIPTANQVLPSDNTLKTGVYVVRVNYEGAIYGGVSNWGRRPQFDNGDLILETHILDFEGDLYDQDIEVQFIAFLRDEAAFDSVDAMMVTIHDDIRRARDIFPLSMEL